MQIWISFKILKNFKSNLKSKKMLFFVVRLFHYCKFIVEHALSTQSFSRPLFNHHHVLSGAYFRCANTTYFISVSVAVG